MKIKHLIILVLAGTLIMPVLTQAQQTAATSKLYSKSNEWSSVQFSQAEKNVKNGVEFYKKTDICDNDTVVFIKIVNSNAYAVNVQWQDDAEKTISFTVPASSELEGKCDLGNNDAEKNLVFQKSEIKKDNNKLKNTFLSTLQVTEVK